jgi:hypothetical protein
MSHKLNSAPDWLASKFPGGHLAQNRAGDSVASRSGSCFDHPGVRQATLD